MQMDMVQVALLVIHQNVKHVLIIPMYYIQKQEQVQVQTDVYFVQMQMDMVQGVPLVTHQDA